MHETRVAHSERAPAALYAQLNRRQSLRSRVGRPIRFGGSCESRSLQYLKFEILTEWSF